MTNMKDFHDNTIKELPPEILEKSIQVIKDNLDIDTVIMIELAYRDDPETWWAKYHHGWGTAIRNLLRREVCHDDRLPSGNFDDYYIPIIEIALGLRKK